MDQYRRAQLEQCRSACVGSGYASVGRSFGNAAGSGQVADMQSAQGVRLLRSLACVSGGESVGGHVHFGGAGYRAAGTNATQQFVGSYNANETPTSTGDIRFHLSNRTSLGSAIP